MRMFKMTSHSKRFVLRALLFSGCFLLIHPLILNGQTAPASESLASPTKTFIEIFKDWSKKKNQGIPSDLKRKCEIYEKEFLEIRDEEGELKPSTFFEHYPDNLLKPLKLSMANQLHIPTELTITNVAAKVKLYSLRRVSLDDKVVLVAEYSSYLGDPGTRPVELNNLYWSTNPCSDAVCFYIQTSSGLKKIFQRENVKYQVHLFRVDKNSPIFFYIYEHDEKFLDHHFEKWGFKETLYQLTKTGTLKKKLSHGNPTGYTSNIFVYDFGKNEKMVVVPEFGTVQDPELLKSYCETYTKQESVGCESIVLYKWDGENFRKLCRYYLMCRG